MCLFSYYRVFSIGIIQGVLIMIIQWFLFIQLLQGVLYLDYTGCSYDYTVVCVYSAITGCSLFRLYSVFLFCYRAFLIEFIQNVLYSYYKGVFIQIIEGLLIQLLQGVLYSD